MTSHDLSYAVVVPTLGRPSLDDCLDALAHSSGPPPRRVVVVDDRPLSDRAPLHIEVPRPLRDRLHVVAGCGNGPAAARNAGWRAVSEPWVAFLDDDTLPGSTWAQDLASDLARAAPDTGAVQGRIHVPLPDGRPPTDWERGTAGLAAARWITADMAYRREVLETVGGFDERFRRAFREDADLALRVLDAGWRLETGRRTTAHPVRPADRWVSVRAQAGNADDVLMGRLHGRGWWARAEAPRGRLPSHMAVTAAAAGALVCAAAGRRGAAAVLAGAWLGGTAEFALARIMPGPRTRQEITAMVLTSAAIPPVACWHRVRGLIRHHDAGPWHPPGSPQPSLDRVLPGHGADPVGSVP
ncbi:glycosyltransferase family 2 protein [Wenjunlia tyrosinilytica]|uniref:Transferase n=1 Tax=Wenjunlia tyrosinilytica TaxID=1544741 RepID=A0A917ZL01_9ACTN|nr:glycosyltransferase [Wenjunlia tyrosinilytica]GGO84717.1 transferase [Wenjunlia tyrosinilytica]